ncbi:hypothetical protein BC831DRAFT_455229 [Entophlyctis helioformis]|nr:hypothetical protein BC831DRAFT_455229 [Entophlyctis helioformis]
MTVQAASVVRAASSSVAAAAAAAARSAAPAVMASSRVLTARLATAAPARAFSAAASSSVRRPALAAQLAQSLKPSMLAGSVRFMSDKVIKTPSMGESITEGTLTKWHKQVGEFVARDEQVATIETDKIDVQVNSPESGKILELFSQEGDTVSVGGNLFKILPGDAPAGGNAAPPAPPAAAPKPAAAAPPKPAAAAPAAPATPAPLLLPLSLPAAAAPKPAAQQPVTFASEADNLPGYAPGARTERRVKMNRMRMRIAERLKESQNTAASLTTFNEVDMTNLIEFRNKYKDLVLEKHGVKLGFMSPFVKAAVHALKELPAVNARIEGDQIVYNDFMDVSVAVATPKGLVTPVVRNCESLSIVQVEAAIAALGKKARDGALSLEDMTGGTFTISNGGVFGSLMGTPIINQPQSAILGMHATKERAVVVNGQVVARPMMYLALTYDHRIIDGREATTFLVKVKEIIEDPRRLLLDL